MGRRRLRIELTVVSPSSTMRTTIGVDPKDPDIGSDPTEDDFKRANLATRLLLGLPMRDEDKALFRSCVGGRGEARR